jgi:hypothetical protein
MTYPSSHVNYKRKVWKILGFQDVVVEIIALLGVGWLMFFPTFQDNISVLSSGSSSVGRILGVCVNA